VSPEAAASSWWGAGAGAGAGGAKAAALPFAGPVFLFLRLDLSMRAADERMLNRSSMAPTVFGD